MYVGSPQPSNINGGQDDTTKSQQERADDDSLERYKST